MTCSSFHKESSEFLEHFDISLNQSAEKILIEVLRVFSQIPYENVSKLNRLSDYSIEDHRILRLPDQVWTEYRNHSLGGTCFSLTYFLQCILDYCKISCYPVTADMKWGQNVHCGLSVVINNQSYWCDPGYLLTEPLLLNKTKKKFYRTESRGICLDFADDIYHLSTFTGNQINWRYKFENKVCPQDKFIHHWLDSFKMPSMNGICLSRQNTDGMLYVHNNYFREVSNAGVKKQRKEFGWISDIESSFGISSKFLTAAYDISKRERI